MRTSRFARSLAPLLALGLFLWASPALATWATWPTILAPGSVSSTQTSATFSTPSDVQRVIFKLQVTVCTTCNITLQLQTQDADGTWIVWHSGLAAVSSVTTQRVMYGCPGGNNANASCYYFADGSTIAFSMNKPMPSIWRVLVVFNSGTDATYTVSAVGF